jgi:hypothetical protein
MHRDNSLGTIFFELTNFKMTFRGRIVVREIDVRALLTMRSQALLKH